VGFLIFSGSEAFSKDISIFAVQKELQMNPKDITQKDFYLNGGVSEGFRKGDLVTVVRCTLMHDFVIGRLMGDLHLLVAKLKIIYVEKNVSIGRFHKSLTSKDKPLVDFKSVMVGDQVLVGQEDDDDSEGKADAKPPEKSEHSNEAPGLNVKAEDVKIEKLPAKETSKADFSSKAAPEKSEKAPPANVPMI
jgi:hypothetical protein